MKGIVAFLLLFVVACSSEEPSRRARQDAEARLFEAIVRTEDSKSFRITVTSTRGGRSVSYYQSPDRVFTKGTPTEEGGPVQQVRIQVGSRFFIEDADRPGYFQELPNPTVRPGPPQTPKFPPGPTLPPARPGDPTPPPPPAPPGRQAALIPGFDIVTGAVDVEATPTGFRFAIDNNSLAGRGEATVREGRIVSITLHSKNERTRFVYDMFDRAPPVTPPPPDRLVPFEPSPTFEPPPCDPDGNPPSAAPGDVVTFCQPRE